ncbi:MAG: hypothetical protein ACR2P0_14460 [Acidimicrobiales bacterium]
MSLPRTYEGTTIEDALLAAAADLGDDLEIVDASKVRMGGIFGFFAREGFVVTAERRRKRRSADDESFNDVLLSLADSVADRYEAPTIDLTTRGEASPSTRTPALDEHPEAAMIDLTNTAANEHPVETESGSFGLIDLRERRRISAPAAVVQESPAIPPPSPAPAPVEAAPAFPVDPPFSFGSERPSKLRSQLSGPQWSLISLRDLGVPKPTLDALAHAGPSTDLEWVRALTHAIDTQIGSMSATGTLRMSADGHPGAVELVNALEGGVRPDALVIDGERIAATAEQLALSIRECLR